jgi:hypothetical protein
MKWASKAGVLLLPAMLACEDGFLVIKTGVFAGNPGFLSATINTDPWTSTRATATHHGGIIIIVGTGTDHLNRLTEIRLVMRTTLGLGPQVIGTGSDASAGVVLRVVTSQFWTASSSQGSGTITLTAMSAEHFEGTFEFDAPRNSSFTFPETYRVVSGTFNVSTE